MKLDGTKARDGKGVMRCLGVRLGQVLYSSPGVRAGKDERTTNKKEQCERYNAN
jgi:hypothetical protein